MTKPHAIELVNRECCAVTHTWFQHVYAETGSLDTLVWLDFAEKLRHGIETIHENTKERVPCFVLARSTDGRAKKESIDECFAIGLDYDHDGDFEEACTYWVGQAVSVIGYTTWNHTPEDQRFRILIGLSRPMKPEEHPVVWKWLHARATAAGHLLDEQAKNAERKWFVPCPNDKKQMPRFEAWLGGSFDVDAILFDSKAPSRAPGSLWDRANRPSIPEVQASDLSRVYAVAESIRSTPKGARNETWNQQIFTLGGVFAARRFDPSIDEQTILSILRQAITANSDRPDREERKLLKSWNDGKRAPLEASLEGASVPVAPRKKRPLGYEARTDANRRHNGEPELVKNWWSSLRTGEKGQVLANTQNFKIIFENSEFPSRLVYDEFYDSLLVKETDETTGETRHRTFREYADVFAYNCWLSSEYLPELPSQGSFSLLQGYAEIHHRRNALQEHLSALRWDGVPRLDRWLVTYLGAEDLPFARQIGKLWLISAMARAFKPGCKADYMLVLEAKQGVGKSTALSILGGDFFSDQISDLSSKDASIDLQRVWIFEFGELDSMERAQVGTIKSFVSRRVDHYRPPYGRYTVDRPRHTIFAGTCNEIEYLKDPTGNRRFWPVAVKQTDVQALKRDRDALLAEALLEYTAGTPWWPEAAVTAMAEEEQEVRRTADPWEQKIATYCFARDSVTTADILLNLGVEPAHQTATLARRVVSIITSQLGFTTTLERRRMPNGRIVRTYVRQSK